MLATRGIQSHKKVPKLKNKRVPIKPSEDGSINMAGRQKAAPINGKGSYNPSWSDFVTAGSIVFPNFYEEPLKARAVNQYKGVLFKYTDGEEYTFPEYHAEVLSMFKVGISADLNLSEATIATRCRKAVRRCNNPQSEIYAFGGLEEHSEAKRLRRAGDADAWNSGIARPDQIARLQRETANGQRKNDCLAVARCVAAQVNIEDTEWAELEPMLISSMCAILVQRGISDAQIQHRIQRCMELGMTWSFMSVADVEVAVTRLLNTTVFAGVSLPLPILELRATCAFYIGFGCQQGYAREQEHYRQLIEEKSKDGNIVSQPALRKMDGSLLDAGDLEALNFKVCILHQDLLAVNARMIETALHRNLFHGPVNKNRLFSHCGAGSYFNDPLVIEKHAKEGRVSEVFLIYAPIAGLVGKVITNSQLPLSVKL